MGLTTEMPIAFRDAIIIRKMYPAMSANNHLPRRWRHWPRLRWRITALLHQHPDHCQKGKQQQVFHFGPINLACKC
jgi:hypothetical protein